LGFVVWLKNNQSRNFVVVDVNMYAILAVLLMVYSFACEELKRCLQKMQSLWIGKPLVPYGKGSAI